MDENQERRYPAGVQPYDWLNGIRIGAVTGGVLGVVPAIMSSGAFAWLVGGAIVGGIVGYVWESRDEARRRHYE